MIAGEDGQAQASDVFAHWPPSASHSPAMSALMSPRRREAAVESPRPDHSHSSHASGSRRSRHQGSYDASLGLQKPPRSGGTQELDRAQLPPSLQRLAVGAGTYPRIVMDEAPRQGDEVWLMLFEGVAQPARVVGVDTVSWPPRARVTRNDTGEMLVVPVLGAEAVTRDPGTWMRDAREEEHVRPASHEPSDGHFPRHPPEAVKAPQDEDAGYGRQPHLKNPETLQRRVPIPPPLDLPSQRVKHGVLEEAKPGDPTTMSSIYQVFEDNFDLVTPRLGESPRHDKDREEDSKVASSAARASGTGGAHSVTAGPGHEMTDGAGAVAENTAAMRKLRDELREDIRRGHSFLKSELQRVLYAQDRRISSRLDLLEARVDRLQDFPRQPYREPGSARPYAEEQITPVRRELQAIRQEVEAQRAFGKAIGTV